MDWFVQNSTLLVCIASVAILAVWFWKTQPRQKEPPAGTSGGPCCNGEHLNRPPLKHWRGK